MRKTLLCAAALCLAGAAFAGKGFRPIHFTDYYTEQNQGLNAPFGAPPLSGPYNRVEGDIVINTEDSTLRITSSGNEPGIYKITAVEAESEDQARGMNEQVVRIRDAGGKAYRVSIQRNTALRWMKVLFIPAGGAYTDPYVVYSCEYLKKLH